LFTRCLICQSTFPANDTLEHFPLGQRVAYDPARGRLWAVCQACRRWSLAPLEERWEALEELEKVTRDGARLLSQTDNISLLRAGPLEIVRVGRANLTEEAWWRYGRELTARKERFQKLSLAGTVAAGTVMVGGWATGGMSLIGMWFLWGNAPEVFTNAARWLRFGRTAWNGDGRCGQCGRTFHSVPYRERGSIYLLPAGQGGQTVLTLRCPGCGDHREGGLLLVGTEAERTLRRLLAYQHFSGASERRVRAATRLIEEAGSPKDLARIVVKDGKRLADLQRTGAIALEISANESAEQRLLELELAELESHWRREEELAEIVDGELTPLPLLETLRKKLTGRA
jgi:hypothetical protein